MAIRITGMNSGLDTESIIADLVKAKKSKVNNLTKAQKSHQIKQDALKELNSKVTKFFNGTVAGLKLTSDYMKKITVSSNSNAVSIDTKGTAMDSMQKLKIKELASTASMTGGKVKDGTASDTRMEDILDGTAFDSQGNTSFDIKVGSTTTQISLTKDSTMSDVVKQLKSAGVNASFDGTHGRLYIGAKESGQANGFEITGTGAETLKALEGLGLSTAGGAKYQAGQDAKIELNGVEYTSSNNRFDINGLGIDCKVASDTEEITLTTQNDTSGIYDMVKNFIKGYNELINEMDKLYNAESSKGYEPLLDEEKEAMTESEIKKWEEKLQASTLRRDSSVNTFASAIKEIMNSAFEVDGKEMRLFDFGIEKMGYFNAGDNEKNAFVINGDSDFPSAAFEDHDLMAMIKSDPDKVVSFFTQLNRALDAKRSKLTAGVDGFRSTYSIYDDKRMKKEYDDYTTKIKEAEKKLTAYEDKWYKKFSRMETAMARMQSNSSAITGLLGGS